MAKFASNKVEYDIIKTLQEKPFAEGNKDTLNSLIDIVAKWRWMAGISSDKQDEDELAQELLIICQFIMKNYPVLNLSDINIAIELSLTNKLECDVRAFNVFSPMYVSRILNAYIEYKKRCVNNAAQLLHKMQEEGQSKKPPPAEQMENMIEMITHFYNQLQSKGELDDHFNMLYNYFRRVRILNPDKKTIDEALEYGKTMSKEYFQKNFKDLFARTKMNTENIEKRFARNYCVKRFFETNSLDNIISMVSIKHFD